MRQANDEERAGYIERTLCELRDGIVVVEGSHDVAALGRVGVEAVTYHRLLANGVGVSSKTVYLLMDMDRGGEEKLQKLVSFLGERCPGCIVNTTSGPKLLKALNVTSIEQMVGPVMEAKQRAEGMKAKANKKNR